MPTHRRRRLAPVDSAGHVKIPRRMDTRRPARKLVVSTATTLTTAVLSLLAAFGVLDLSDEQRAAVLGLVAVLAPLAGAAAGYLARPGQYDQSRVET